jgi:hypothetical protein
MLTLCACVHVCVCVLVCMHVCLCTCMFVHACACAYLDAKGEDISTPEFFRWYTCWLQAV